MFVYSSFKMEGDSAVRGYRDAQINRFESQLSEINLLKFITGRRRHCKQLCGGMAILCCVTFSSSRKAAINRLKDLLTKAFIKVSIHWNVRHLFEMFPQISCTPDFEQRFLEKRCGLSAGVYGTFCQFFGRGMDNSGPGGDPIQKGRGCSSSRLGV